MRPIALAATSLIALCMLTACQRADNRAHSAPPQRIVETIDHYAVLEPGDEILDTDSRLIWTRCALGEVWNGSFCDGMAREVTLAEAPQAAPEGWRVPSIRELASLVHCSSGRFSGKTDIHDGLPALNDTCVNSTEPALHALFVPRNVDLIHGVGYWSATPMRNTDQFIGEFVRHC